jgi:HAD superfamily hydrolase (TIGR01509 family)
MAGHEAPRGVFFDMDGTLLDSEPLTDALILRLVEEHRLSRPDFPLSQFHGMTWERIAEILTGHYPALSDVPLADRLQREFHRALLAELPPLIPGVQRAFANASQVCTTGVVSSSQRETIEAVIENAGLAAICPVVVGAEDVKSAKPDPECYLLAAERAAANASRCLVFEDSSAGVHAARAAGMFTVGVVGNRDSSTATRVLSAADLVIQDYRSLPADFFSAFGHRR